MRGFFLNFFTIITKKRILDPMVSSTRFSRVEHVARPIDLDRIQSLIKEKGLDPLNSVSQMDCFQGGPLQWAVITEETGYRIYVRFDFTKDRELNYAWKIHFLAIKIADSFDSIRSIDDKKKLKKRRRRKKRERIWKSNLELDQLQSAFRSWSTNDLGNDRTFDVYKSSRVLGEQLYFLVMYSMNSFRVPITQHIYIYTALVILSCTLFNTN